MTKAALLALGPDIYN